MIAPSTILFCKLITNPSDNIGTNNPLQNWVAHITTEGALWPTGTLPPGTVKPVSAEDAQTFARKMHKIVHPVFATNASKNNVVNAYGTQSTVSGGYKRMETLAKEIASGLVVLCPECGHHRLININLADEKREETPLCCNECRFPLLREEFEKNATIHFRADKGCWEKIGNSDDAYFESFGDDAAVVQKVLDGVVAGARMNEVVGENEQEAPPFTQKARSEGLEKIPENSKIVVKAAFSRKVGDKGPNVFSKARRETSLASLKARHRENLLVVKDHTMKDEMIGGGVESSSSSSEEGAEDAAAEDKDVVMGDRQDDVSVFESIDAKADEDRHRREERRAGRRILARHLLPRNIAQKKWQNKTIQPTRIFFSKRSQKYNQLLEKCDVIPPAEDEKRTDGGEAGADGSPPSSAGIGGTGFGAGTGLGGGQGAVPGFGYRPPHRIPGKRNNSPSSSIDDYSPRFHQPKKIRKEDLLGRVLPKK